MASSENQVFTGRCICGDVKFEFTIPAGEKFPGQSLCHCIYCKRMTGACFTRNTMAPASTFKLLSGTPKQFVQRQDKPRGTFFFCPECGIQTHATHDTMPGNVVIRVGTLDRQAEFNEAVMQLNCENQSTWLVDALQKEEGKFERFPPHLGKFDEGKKGDA